ncbi:unnamed protein product [Paramecium octaurelia]|uniref:Uncharacterized protein n=1 Tax=Paramecium octaurelia TaxID=43137 RepID=A0A8S1VJT4_PAROT|nr:unnamed protein product [Paramecium octaurelia]
MEIIELKEEEAYRISDPTDIVQVTLIEGAVEIFGQELLLKKLYEFPPHKPFSLFCWVQSKLKIKYKTKEDQPGYIFNEEELNYHKMMHDFLKINHVLESQRQMSFQQTDKIGPRLLVLGSHSCGKNTLCKTLINYSLVYGWKPIYVDIDPDNQQSEYPHSIRAEVQTCVKEQMQKNRVTYYFGYQYKDIVRDISKRMLFDRLTEELSVQVDRKLQADLERAKEQKVQMLNQLGKVKDQKLCELIYMKSQEDKDEKEIYASGIFVNCPNFLGLHNQIMEQIKFLIEKFKITMVIVIDKPDIYRDLDKIQDIIVYKMEKLKGVVDSYNLKELESLNYTSFQSSQSIPENQLELYQMQVREDKQIMFEKTKSTNIVKLTIAVLHLKKTQLEESNTELNSKLILQAPLAFLAYVDNFDKDKGYLIQIPNDNCRQTLQNNVCIIGR